MNNEPIHSKPLSDFISRLHLESYFFIFKGGVNLNSMEKITWNQTYVNYVLGLFIECGIQ